MDKSPLILAVMASMLLLSCTNLKSDTPIVTDYTQWSDIDFWEYGIVPPSCVKTDESELCEIRTVDQGVIDIALTELKKATRGGDLQHIEVEGLHVFATRSHEKTFFICCDIQGPLSRVMSSSGESFSMAAYRLPLDSVFSVEPLSDPKFFYDTEFIGDLDRIQSAVASEMKAAKEKVFSKIEASNLEGRSLFLFRSNEEPPEHIILLNDGHLLKTLSRLLNLDIVPSSKKNFAIIGIVSAEDSDERNAEYLKPSDGDIPQQYVDYESFVLKTVIPHVREELSLDQDVPFSIAGFSSGANSAANLYLDHPGSFCNVVVVALAGDPLEVRATDMSYSHTNMPQCGKAYLSVGKHDGPSFVSDTKASSEVIEQAGYDSKFVLENSGHSPFTFYMAFLRALGTVVE